MKHPQLMPGNDAANGRMPRGVRRRGIASMLAMLFLVLFSTLAVGFFVASTMNAQIARNEKLLNQAASAADGGMQFIRYQLGQITLAADVQTSGLMDAVASALGTQLNNTSNMNGHTVVNTNGTIYIPSAGDWITVDSTVGTRFRARITQSGQFLVVSVDGTGTGSSVVKAIQLQYQKAPKAGAILNYGIATEGTVTTGGSTIITGLTDPTKGSILSADTVSGTPVTIGGKQVSGDISIVNPSGNVSVSGASVGGTSDPTKILDHIHKGVTAPTFPTVDVSVFTAYATNKYTSGNTITNAYIPANTNPKFNGGVTINGVLYIQSPNVVTFNGNATINGVIVTDTTGSFDAAKNQINFGGTVSATPINQLATSNPAYDPNLVKLTGSFLLAPNYAVSFTGNFGTVGGSVVAGQVSMTGNATGTVQGSIIGMTDNPMLVNGSADIYIASTGTSNYPSGLSFGNDYTPLPGTYLEVAPW